MMTKRKAKIVQTEMWLDEGTAAEAEAEAEAEAAPGAEMTDRILVRFTGKVCAVLAGKMILHNETRWVSRTELAHAEQRRPGEFEIIQEPLAQPAEG